jgi:GT2 family glycosyltransferase
MNVPQSLARPANPASSGKFTYVDGQPFLIRGVAYGSFAPREDGHEFPEPFQVRRDFDLMVCAGINTVRTYTVPPPDVLDEASAHGLRIMAGLAWPQHIAFLDDRHLSRGIIRSIGCQARSIARHPALLMMAVGNEIPPAVVRWHGTRRVERFVRAAFDEARSAAPDVLLTYVNYPPTEFLELPFFDVCAFNVYLHDEDDMRAYVARLQHIAGDRPLLLTECGADSQRHGEPGQAALAAMQVRVAFSEGAAGVIVFGWTDEWWRGGSDIADWSFGLVDRERRPKAACAAITAIFRNAPFGPELRPTWPAVSVIVCAYNAAATIDDCLDALERLDYPRVEVIVVDDGSTDDTAARVRARPWARLIQVPNGGLSTARNIGLHASCREIVAYVDADVRVDPSWLTYLVQPFVTSDAVAAGGPNVVPSDDHWFAQCVARAPGAPSHVLIDDRVAEHVPGCNFAVKRSALLSIGGFDPLFLRAGDDVDVCWRLQARGGRIAFSPAALVWHHHRNSLSAYWRQQAGYGEGEAWLRMRHRHRFSRANVAWRGRIYSNLPFVQSLTERQLHSGVWGTAAFPTVYRTGASPMQSLPHSAEWEVGALALLALGVAGLGMDDDRAPVMAIVVGLTALCITFAKCAIYAWRSEIDHVPVLARGDRALNPWLYRATIAWLHVVQPVARSYGYVRGTLQPPATAHAPDPGPAPAMARDMRNQRRSVALVMGRSVHCRFWSETWASGDALLARIVARLRGLRLGRDIQIDDGWRPDRDVSVALGLWAWAHLRALVEDHGTGRCLLRIRIEVRPRVAAGAVVALTLAAIVASGRYGGPVPAGAIAVCALAAAASVARILTRHVAEILDVVAASAGDYGMQAVPAVRRPPRVKPLSSWWRRPTATHGG